MSSNIEWTDETWNPVIGCTPVSAGCLNCYAATMARRLEAMGRPEYAPRWLEGSEDAAGNTESLRIAEVRGGRAVFTGDVRTQPQRLADPLNWRKPRRIFVCSMSDLFHESVPFEFINRVWAVMLASPQHTFQVLTKRPERMAKFFAGRHHPWYASSGPETPAPNVWLGTSVEDQKAADERIPHLLRCPAAVRFLSCEPLLGPVALSGPGCGWCFGQGTMFAGSSFPCRACIGIDWVILGGESGPKARPCDVAWLRGVVGQCREAGVPVFVKQLGAAPFYVDEPAKRCGGAVAVPVAALAFGGWQHTGKMCRDRKGGDPAEWPEDLRVREWPRVGGGA